MPPTFEETCKHGLLHPDHPGTWDIDTTCGHLVSELGPVVLEVFPRGFLVTDVAVSKIVPPTPLETRVVVLHVFPYAPSR